jgi:hypothetical protein
MMTPFWPLVIELGSIRISSAVPLADLLWFAAGLIMLAGSSAAVLWWSRRSRPDPFV